MDGVIDSGSESEFGIFVTFSLTSEMYDSVSSTPPPPTYGLNNIQGNHCLQKIVNTIVTRENEIIILKNHKILFKLH